MGYQLQGSAGFVDQQLRHAKMLEQANVEQAAAIEKALAEQRAYADQTNQYLSSLMQAQQAAQSSQQETQSGGPKLSALYEEFVSQSGTDGVASHNGLGVSSENSTWANRKGLDNFLSHKAKMEGWNDLQIQKARKQIMDDAYKATGNAKLFEVEDRGITGLIGDTANRLVGAFVGGIGDLLVLGSTVGGEALNKIGLGDGRLDFSHAMAEAFESAGKSWRDLRSDEDKDADLALQQAKGVADTLDAIADNPIALLGLATDTVGMLGGGGFVGGAAKLGGKALMRQGIKQMLSGGKNVAAKTLAEHGIKGELAAAVAGQMSTTTGLSAMYARGMGAAKHGLGKATHAAGTAIAKPSPLTYGAAFEGAGTATDILTQDGAFNAETGQYNGDVLATALGAGAINAGITYGLGRLTGTVEGTFSRTVSGTARRAEASSLGSAVLNTKGGAVTLDDALSLVKTDLSKGLTQGASDVLEKATAALKTAEAKQAVLSALSPKSTLRSVWTGTKAVTGGMIAEGFEEGLVAAIASTAGQAVKDDGTFDISKVNWGEVVRQAGNAATVGALLGVASGSVNAALAFKDNVDTVDGEIAKYREKVGALQSELDTALAPKALPAPSENSGGLPAAQTDPSAPAGDAAPSATDAAEAAKPSAAASSSALLTAIQRIQTAMPAEERERRAAIAAQNGIPYDVQALAEYYGYNGIAKELERHGYTNVPADVRQTLELMGKLDLLSEVAAYQPSDASVQNAVSQLRDVLAKDNRKAKADRWLAAEAGRLRENETRLREQGLQRSSAAPVSPLVAAQQVTAVQPAAQANLFSAHVVTPTATPKAAAPTAATLSRLGEHGSRFNKNRIAKTFSVPAGAAVEALSSVGKYDRIAVAEVVAALDSGLVTIDTLLSDPAVVEAVTIAAQRDTGGQNAGDVEGKLEEIKALALMVQETRSEIPDGAVKEAAEKVTKKLVRHGDSTAEAAKRAIEAGVVRVQDKPKTEPAATDTDLPPESKYWTEAEKRKYRENMKSAKANKQVEADIAAGDSLFGTSDFDDDYRFETSTTSDRVGGSSQYQRAVSEGRTELTYHQWKQVRAPEFKAWFGDWENDPANASKVINPRTGEPLAVYHGTASDFDVFSVAGKGRTNGSYFTSDPQVASQYAGDGAVYAVFLNIRNPDTLDAYGNNWQDIYGDSKEFYLENQYGEPVGDGLYTNMEDAAYAIEDAEANGDVVTIHEGYSDGAVSTDSFAYDARAAGNDGAVIRDVQDNHISGDSTIADTFVVFSPTQIKSATGNNGKFSADDPRITFEREPTPREVLETNDRILAATQNKYGEWLSSVFGRGVLDRIVFVAPASSPNPSANGFTKTDDPSRIHVVLHPGRTREQVVWTVAHEMLHTGMTLRFDGKVVATSNEYKSLMADFAAHPFVAKLREKMRDRYPNVSDAVLTEEALAELFAAVRTKDYAGFRQRNGLDVPAGLRSVRTDNPLARVIRYIRKVISSLTGKKTVTDGMLQEFLSSATNFEHVFDPNLSAPDMVDRLTIDAMRSRRTFYTDLMERTVPHTDTLTGAEQAHLKTKMAQDRGDRQAEREFRYEMDNTFDDMPNKWHAADVNDNPPKFKARTVEAETIDRHNAQAKEMQGRTDEETAANIRHAIFDSHLMSVVIYPTRSGRSSEDLDVTDWPVGTIQYNNQTRQVQAVIKDPNTGINWKKAYDAKDVKAHQIPALIEDAKRDIFNAYGEAFDFRSGTQLHESLWYNNGETPPPLDFGDAVIIDKFAMKAAENPNLYRIATWLKKYFPDNFWPIIDRVMDFLDWAYVYFVDKNDAAKALNRAFNEATGENNNVVAQWLTDQGKADAYTARTTTAYQGGDSFKDNWRDMNYADGMSSIYDAVRDSNMSSAEITQALYALEEANRAAWLLAKNGIKDENGNLFLPDPASATGKRPRETVTGFRYRDRDTTDLTQGAADFGAKRFLADFKNWPAEKRLAIGKIAAALAATNRAVTQLELSHNVISPEMAQTFMTSGHDMMAELFPEMAAQGYDFGGYHLSMRDMDSNPYTMREASGRSTIVKDPLAVTQRVLKARIRMAFGNKELANLAAMVVRTPNNHFGVSTVVTAVDENGEIHYKTTDKGEKAKIVIYVDGLPITLTAKSRKAKAMLESKDPHEVIKKVGVINHFFNTTKTTYNLAYIPIGFLRDLMTGYMNVSGALGEHNLREFSDAPKLGLATLKYALQSLPNTFRTHASGKNNDPYYEVFLQNGYGMFFGDQYNTGALRGLPFNRITANPLVRKAGNVIEAFGQTPETAVRIGNFRALMEYFFKDQLGPNPTAKDIQAILDDPANKALVADIAQSTKKITVNFQQHGENNVIRYTMSFFNAVVQGSFATLPSILSTRHGRQTAGMMLLASVIASAFGIADEEEDEFGNSKFFQYQQRNRFIIIDGKKFPINDELGLFHSLGQNLSGIMLGKRNVVDAAVDVWHSAMDMITPNSWGRTDNGFTNFLYAASPTMAHGFIGLASGKDMFGNDLKAKSVYDDNGRMITNPTNVERTTARASGLGTDLARLLYGSSGGDWDMSGNEIDFLGRQYLGGVYGVVSRGWDKDGKEGGAFEALLAEPFRGFKAYRETNEGREAWDKWQQRIGIASRNQGTMVDVLSKGDKEVLKEQADFAKRANREMKNARSPRGYNVKQIRDAINRAEREGRWSDVRDLQSDLSALYEERDRIRGDAIREARELGYM